MSSSSSSFFSIASSLGSAAFSAAKQVAQTAAETTKKTLHELRSVPSEVQCTGCQLALKVPNGIYDWACPTPECAEKGVTYSRDVEECHQCNVARQDKPALKSIACDACQAITEVPMTNADKHYRAGKKGVIDTGTKVKEVTLKAYEDMNKLPTHINCKHCSVKLEVPEALFDWACPQDGCEAIMKHEDKACTQCHFVRQKQAAAQPPSVQCGACEKFTLVPLTNARRLVGEAAHKTQQFAAAATASAKNQYQHLKADPNQFNCEHCTQLLEVPPQWICKACHEFNSRKDHPDACVKCQAPRSQVPQDDVVMCGGCSMSCVIPKSNARNLAQKNATQGKRALAKLLYQVSGKPYINCDNCGSTIALPVPKEGEPGPVEVACKECGKTFQPRASQQLEGEEPRAMEMNEEGNSRGGGVVVQNDVLSDAGEVGGF